MSNKTTTNVISTEARIHLSCSVARKMIRALAFLFLATTCLPALAAPPVAYHEPIEDLRVKVLGGAVVIQRSFTDGKWHPNLSWAPLKLTLDSLDGSVKGITRDKFEYVKTAPGVFAYLKRNTIRQTQTGFRWADRSGNWIDYDPQGLITAYGDRNDVKVTFVYETIGSGKRISGIKDHLDRQVIWYEYTNDQLTAIRDHTNRRVRYQYTSGNLTSVIDVNGHTWTYGYTDNVPTTFTDPENRTIARTWANNGEIASIRYADGVGTDYKYEYDSGKTLYYRQEKTTGGRITETWTNKDGEVVRQDLNGKTQKALSIDTVGRTRTETDPRGLKTVRTYDEWDNEIKITYPDGATVTITYDPIYSNPLQKTNELGVITKYEYDTKGNLTKLTEALGKPEQRVTEYVYDTQGRRLTETKKGGTVTLPDNSAVTIADATTA
ncbi:MAG TPA: hypothetical protein VJS66_09345, partial [Burkholderiales bacterium]|nr:hypothetical protein [Burkholderiales bacterium]